RSPRGRAILHVTVAATGIDIGDARHAAANRTWSGLPVPWLLRRGGAAVGRVEVGVDLGLCIRRLYPDDHCQDAQAADESVLHDFLLWTRRVREATTHPHRVNVPDY